MNSKIIPHNSKDGVHLIPITVHPPDDYYTLERYIGLLGEPRLELGVHRLWNYFGIH